MVYGFERDVFGFWDEELDKYKYGKVEVVKDEVCFKFLVSNYLIGYIKRCLFIIVIFDSY